MHSLSMIPTTVMFTGCYINPLQELVAFRVVKGPFPISWERVMISYPLLIHCSNSLYNAIIKWVVRNVDGRFGVNFVETAVAIYFEDPNDAILFKMKDGEENILQKENL